MKFKQKGSVVAELVTSIVITGILLVGIVIWKGIACNNYGTLTDRITKFSVINGCYVKTDTGWIPEEEMSKRAYGNSITEAIPSSK